MDNEANNPFTASLSAGSKILQDYSLQAPCRLLRLTLLDKPQARQPKSSQRNRVRVPLPFNPQSEHASEALQYEINTHGE